MDQLSDLDLESSAMACRALAHVRRKDAEANPGGTYTAVFVAEAERLQKLAARYQAELERRRAAK